MRLLTCTAFLAAAIAAPSAGQKPPSSAPELVLQSGHGALIAKMAFSRDGGALVTEGFEGALKVWDIRSSSMRREIRTERSRIDGQGPGAWQVSAKGDYILAQTSVFRNIAEKIDVATGKGHDGYGSALDKEFWPVTALAESADGKWHAVANSSGFTVAYGPDNLASLIQQKGASATGLWINPRTDELFVRYSDGSNVLWALGRGPRGRWPDLKITARAQVAFDADDNLLVLEPLKDGFELFNLTKGQARSRSCSCWNTTLSEDGSRIAWLEEENDRFTHLRIASAGTLKIVATLPPPRFTMQMAANRNGTVFAFGDLYGDVSLVSEADPVVRRLSGETTPPAALVWYDDSTLRMVTAQGGIVEWSPSAAATVSRLATSDAQMTALSENGHALAFASLAGLRVWAPGMPGFEQTGLKIVDPDGRTHVTALALDDSADAVAWTVTELDFDPQAPELGRSVSTLYTATHANGWKAEKLCSTQHGVPQGLFPGSKLVTVNCAAEGANKPAASFVAAIAGAGMALVARDNSAEIRTPSESFSIETGVSIPVTGAISPDGHYAAVVRLSQVAILDLRSRTRIALWNPVSELTSGTFATSASGPKVAVSNDGLVYLMNGRGMLDIYRTDGQFLGNLVPDGNHWLVTDAAGRFDTDRIENLNNMVRWRLSDDPGRVLPLEIFMRQYFTPRLFRRLAAGEAMPPLPDLTALNRAQPEVRITEIGKDAAHPGRVSVRVKVASRTETGARGPMISGAKDLRVFREGRLVGFIPGTLDRDEYLVDNIRLPFSANEAQLEFSAYALNTDQVKSPTDRANLKVSATQLRRSRAFLLHIGVNWNQAEGCSLEYAATDAKVVSEDLEAAFRSLSPVVTNLISADAAHNSATREDIRKGLERIARLATPDDVFVMTYSGHGYTAPDGRFYLLPSDWKGSCDGGEVDKSSLESAISTDDLTEWLRPLDAGEMIMVLDACYSAASVESGGFKPGPMGSQGLGQLAYDKRIRILTASQSTQAARETPWLGMGLLSFALTRDGLEAHEADFQPHDGFLWSREWLDYAVKRVPELYEGLRAGDPAVFRNAPRGVAVEKRPTGYNHSELQTPALFDFVQNDPKGPLLWKSEK